MPMSQHRLTLVAPEPQTEDSESGITISDWRPLNQGQLLGTFSATFRNGMIFRECKLFERNGQRSVSTPQKQYRVGDATKYAPVVDFVDRATRDRFSEKVLAAVEQHLRRSR
jgi:hypothetical protein